MKIFKDIMRQGESSYVWQVLALDDVHKSYIGVTLKHSIAISNIRELLRLNRSDDSGPCIKKLERECLRLLKKIINFLSTEGSTKV